MITIAIINNQPSTPIPEGTIAILNNGQELQCYFEGDTLPAVLQPQPEVAQPNWTGLVATFTFPGNSLYLSIVSKVGDCPYHVRDHWENFKEVVTNLHNTEALAAGVAHLSNLLAQNDQPLSVGEAEGWNELVEQFNFPENCKL